MTLYLTDKAPKTEIGSTTVVLQNDPETLMIPPGQSSFKHYAFCSSACTDVRKFIEIITNFEATIKNSFLLRSA